MTKPDTPEQRKAARAAARRRRQTTFHHQRVSAARSGRAALDAACDYLRAVAGGLDDTARRQIADAVIALANGRKPT